jgi:hypothetical protein
MELNAGGYTVDNANFKIWNYPGLSVSDTNPAIEITSATGLSAILANLSGQYVLAQDITNSSHTPIGTSSAPFTGKFYGGGHTITINGFSNSTYTGLFGYTNNALIRDLTVAYNTTIASNAIIQYLGGITGYADGSTEIRNIVTSGSLGATLAYTGEKYIGGITGYMANTVTIANIGAGLNLSATDIGSNDVFFGGITGDTVSGAGTRVAMSEVSVTGTLTHTQAGGVMNVGGVGGRFQAGVSISDAEFTGDIKVNKTGTGDSNVGGVAGTADGATFTGCRSVARSVGAESSAYISIGGFLGVFYSGTYTNCYARTDVFADGGDAVRAGGFAGYVSLSGGTSTISQCYATGNVDIKSTAAFVAEYRNPIAGGLIGHMFKDSAGSLSLENSYSLGNVSVTGADRAYAGGLVGRFDIRTGGSGESGISNCFAAGNVSAKSRSNGNSGAGGIVSRIDNTGTGTTVVRNNAAIGDSVTLMGVTENRSFPARIYVWFEGPAPAFSNNYAKDSMRVERSNSFNTISFPYWNGSDTAPAIYYTTNPPDTGAGGRNGISASAFYNPSFWVSQMSYSSAYWDFSTGVGRGHPILRGMGGQ